MGDEKIDELAGMLEHAGAEKMAGDPILRKAFSVALLASDLFLPVHENKNEQAKAGGVSLHTVKINGAPHVMMFSSKEKLSAFVPDGTRFARAPGAQVLPSIRGTHAVLNPGPSGRVFAPEDFDEILGGAPKHGQPGHVHGPDCNHDH